MHAHFTSSLIFMTMDALMDENPLCMDVPYIYLDVDVVDCMCQCPAKISILVSRKYLFFLNKYFLYTHKLKLKFLYI